MGRRTFSARPVLRRPTHRIPRRHCRTGFLNNKYPLRRHRGDQIIHMEVVRQCRIRPVRLKLPTAIRCNLLLLPRDKRCMIEHHHQRPVALPHTSLVVLSQQQVWVRCRLVLTPKALRALGIALKLSHRPLSTSTPRSLPLIPPPATTCMEKDSVSLAPRPDGPCLRHRFNQILSYRPGERTL